MTPRLQRLGTRNPVKRRILWVCLFLCIAGAALVCTGGKTCLKAWQSRDWPATPCVIDNSGINSSFKPGHQQTYTFFVSFHYSFNGQDYNSATGTLDPQAEMDLKWAGALSNRYGRGDHAMCYVNPQNPTDAVLDRSVSRRDVLASVGGVALVMVSLAGVMVARKRSRG